MRSNIFSLLRKVGAGKLTRRSVHISCRGKPISISKLFEYTNGNFLVSECSQRDRRYVQFDFNALCDLAAAAGGESSPVNSVEKMEGGFCKALLMKKENGTEVIAKIPCPNAGPPFYTTESEVAVLKYVKQHTSVPVPEVFSWSSDAKNPVGAEYIIMEKASGVQAFKIWGEISESDKLELIKQLTIFEHALSSIQLPAYGSLYLREACGNMTASNSLDSDADPSKSYCVGRSTDRSYAVDDIDGLEMDVGPWTTLSAFGIAIAKREIDRISRGSSPHPGTFFQGTYTEQTNLLENTIDLMKLLDTHPILSKSAKPVLWHTDLHMGNIYVSPSEPSKILSFIDWQSISILPFFMQARWPIFLEPPQDFTKGFEQPKLPDNYDELDAEEKQIAKYEYKQTVAAKVYEVSSFLENRAAYTAMNLPRIFKELFKRCGETSEVGILPLQACLIEVFESWSELGFSGECPYSFTPEEISEHESRFKEYEHWHKAHEIARKCLDTDEDGWIAPELDIKEKRKQNEELLNMFIEHMADEKSPQESRRMWPFIEGNDVAKGF